MFERLADLIKASPQIKVICAGQVHQGFAGQVGAATMYTTPSTCVQFGARPWVPTSWAGAGVLSWFRHSSGMINENGGG